MRCATRPSSWKSPLPGYVNLTYTMCRSLRKRPTTALTDLPPQSCSFKKASPRWAEAFFHIKARQTSLRRLGCVFGKRVDQQHATQQQNAAGKIGRAHV